MCASGDLITRSLTVLCPFISEINLHIILFHGYFVVQAVNTVSDQQRAAENKTLPACRLPSVDFLDIIMRTINISGVLESNPSHRIHSDLLFLRIRQHFIFFLLPTNHTIKSNKWISLVSFMCAAISLTAAAVSSVQ